MDTPPEVPPDFQHSLNMRLRLCAGAALAAALVYGPISGQTTVLDEDFNSGVIPPPGWSEINRGMTAGWEDDIAQFAFHDDFTGASDVDLLSPVFDLSGLTQAYLHAVQVQTFSQFRDTNEVRISLDGGLSFVTVYSESGSIDGSQSLEADLSAYAGLTGVQLSFYYSGTFANEWRIDTAVVDDLPFQPPKRWPNLPTDFRPVDGFFEGFDTLGQTVPPHLAVNALDAVSREADPEAWCNLGQNAPCLEPSSGQNALEMGLKPGSAALHDVANALVIGLDGSGATYSRVDFLARQHQEEPHPDDGVFLSLDGESWVPLLTDWELALGVGNEDWTPLSVDLNDAGLDLSSTFYLAFSQSDDFPYAELDGVGIDEISIGGAPSLRLDFDQVTNGQLTNLTVSGATPGSVVTLAWSFEAGPFLTPYGWASIGQPYTVISNPRADAAGQVVKTIFVPNVAVGLTIYLQALEFTAFGTGIFTNPMTAVVQ